MRKRNKTTYLISVLAMTVLLLAGCSNAEDKAYGVFLGAEGSLDRLSDYELVVIDAQYYSKEEISSFKADGHSVYSYINIGSLEEFRDYYEKFKDLSLGDYENWDGEHWVDISDERWQGFLTGELKGLLLKKGIDGFFVDNCDIYYHYPTQGIMDGITKVMSDLIRTGLPVVINGGDAYLDAFCNSGGSWSDVITGINQESVFSRIIWENGTFGTASDEDRHYFQEYVEKYAAKGADIYLLEYTEDPDLRKQILEYCKEHGFICYISDSLELE